MALSNMFGSMFAPAPAPVTDPIQQQLMMQLQQLVDGFGVPNPSSASPIAPILGQAAATDPAHILKSNFKRVFYASKSPSVVYPPPPELTPEEAKAAALSNPDPTKFTPVVVHGFTGLQAKVKQQRETVESFISTGDKLYGKLKDLELEACECGRKADALRLRVERSAALRIRVLGKVSRLLSLRTPLTPAEVELKDMLSRVLRDLRAPGQYSSKLSELSAFASLQDSFKSHAGSLTDDQVEIVRQSLEAQQVAIAKLQEVLRKDARDLEIIHGLFPLEGFRGFLDSAVAAAQGSRPLALMGPGTPATPALNPAFFMTK